MATVNYSLKSKKNPANIYCRFSNGRKCTLDAVTGLFVNPAHWNPKSQTIRNVIEVANRDELNSVLAKMKIAIVDAYNLSFAKGEVIDNKWLKETIGTYFNRVKGEGIKENDHKIYLSDYAEYWIKTKAPKWKVKAGKYMDKTTIRHYKILADNIVKFEGKRKIRLKDVSAEMMDEFSTFLTKEKYATKTTTRMIGRLKFFCERAESDNIPVNKNYKQRVFVAKEETEYLKAYLTENEITRIYKYDFSYNESLDNARDNFVIGLLTGLRISDFLRRLDVSNFADGYIDIKTTKTGTPVTIPVHPYVERILMKRNGELPRKISDQKFNDYIKNICQVLDIDNGMIGGVAKVDPVTKKMRKVIGTYPKYELISSHSCRRSFATNNFGKIPNAALCQICGWKTETMMMNYILKSNRESADLLKAHWEKDFKE